MTIQICAKCSDLCSVTLLDQGDEIASKDGYVPDFMPGEHYGDYIMLDIDSDTGKILNWKTLTVKALKEWARRDN